MMLILLFLVGCQRSPRNTTTKRPNVLFIAVDDLNDWIQVLDSTAPVETPNLSRLANRGMLFTKAYCSSPSCNPSRVSVLTGISPSTSGVYGNRTDWRGAMPEAVTLPQYFKMHGYQAVGAGKIFHHHFGGAFHDDSSFDKFSSMPDPPDSPMPANKLNALPWWGSVNSDWGVWPEHPGEHVDIKTTDFIIDQLQEEHASPFFLAAGIFRPHMPFFAPAEYFEKYPADKVTMPSILEEDLDDLPLGAMQVLQETEWFFDGIKKADAERPGTWKDAVRAYQACASFADAQIGRIIHALERSPYRDNTIIVLWSDHGYHLGEKKHWEKFALWEKTTHVPLIVIAPGITKQGSVCDQPVSLLDIYPTLVELCSLDRKSGLEGISLVPLLKDPQQKREVPAVMTHGKDNHAIRSDSWRYIRYADGSEELYDLENDPHEWYNLAGKEEMKSVITDLKQWLPKVNTPAYRDMKKPGN